MIKPLIIRTTLSFGLLSTNASSGLNCLNQEHFSNSVAFCKNDPQDYIR